MRIKEKKYTVYELDFGDTNILSENIKEITDWIATDMEDLGNGDKLEYTIKIRMLTRKQINNIPEWA